MSWNGMGNVTQGAESHSLPVRHSEGLGQGTVEQQPSETPSKTSYCHTTALAIHPIYV